VFGLGCSRVSADLTCPLVSLSSTPVGDQPWRPLVDNRTPADYADLFRDFTVATLRCLRGHPSEYLIPLTDVQVGHARRFEQTIGDPDAEPFETLHAFLVSLFEVQPEDVTDDFDDGGRPLTGTLPCYLALKALREDGTFIPPGTYSGFLARFKYLACTVAAIEARRLRLALGGMIRCVGHLVAAPPPGMKV
jgi:hypothetical protein